MQTSLYVILPGMKHLPPIKIFAYRSQGVPGLEIIGFGNYGRIIKEKIIYLSKEMNLKVPLRRYVVCLGEGLHGQEQKMAEWFEFPILMIFWYLTENLPLERLDNCVTLGKIHVDGSIIQPKDLKVDLDLIHHKTLISLCNPDQSNQLPWIDPRDVFANLCPLRFEIQ